MENKNIVSEYLSSKGLYPVPNTEAEQDGLVLLPQKNGKIVLSGSADDLIEFADLLVSLALSGENKGQHWHIDNLNMLSEKSEIPGIIVMRDVFKEN